MKPLRVLVIGGTRFMGYHLVWRLLAGGHQVTVLNRGRTPDPFGARVGRITGDREDLKKLLAGRSFDAAVDFIAYTGDDVAQAVEALPGVAHYVLISTGQVYLVRQNSPRPARESDYDGPLMPAPEARADRDEWDYGVGKRAAEDVLREAFRARNFPGTVLRIPVVNGERDNSRRLENYLWRLLDGDPILLPTAEHTRGLGAELRSGSGTIASSVSPQGPRGGIHSRPVPPEVLRHVYCHDVVRVVESVLTGDDVMGQAYNICQQEAPTLLELVTLLAELMGARPCLVEVSAEQLAGAGLAPRAVSPFSSRWISHIDPSRAMAELDFRPTPLRQAMASIVASFLAHLPASPPETYATRPRETALARAVLGGTA